ncbi:hypothetical protein NP233_g9181 [Leucocoprinus birnbaumii]|uniref:Integrase core domain-containing protein n=1 Tax=Leucocoprinus birnbaumii TaxID=56174 RepID=A0AAD5VL33_9AGAR|nr:hypothetical protein NP233_g9181 [Leucocoprinus birnbaumii]
MEAGGGACRPYRLPRRGVCKARNCPHECHGYNENRADGQRLSFSLFGVPDAPVNMMSHCICTARWASHEDMDSEATPITSQGSHAVSAQPPPTTQLPPSQPRVYTAPSLALFPSASGPMLPFSSVQSNPLPNPLAPFIGRTVNEDHLASAERNGISRSSQRGGRHSDPGPGAAPSQTASDLVRFRVVWFTFGFTAPLDGSGNLTSKLQISQNGGIVFQSLNDLAVYFKVAKSQGLVQEIALAVSLSEDSLATCLSNKLDRTIQGGQRFTFTKVPGTHSGGMGSAMHFWLHAWQLLASGKPSRSTSSRKVKFLAAGLLPQEFTLSALLLFVCPREGFLTLPEHASTCLSRRILDAADLWEVGVDGSGAVCAAECRAQANNHNEASSSRRRRADENDVSTRPMQRPRTQSPRPASPETIDLTEDSDQTATHSQRPIQPHISNVTPEIAAPGVIVSVIPPSAPLEPVQSVQSANTAHVPSPIEGELTPEDLVEPDSPLHICIANKSQFGVWQSVVSSHIPISVRRDIRFDDSSTWGKDIIIWADNAVNGGRCLLLLLIHMYGDPLVRPEQPISPGTLDCNWQAEPRNLLSQSGFYCRLSNDSIGKGVHTSIIHEALELMFSPEYEQYWTTNAPDGLRKPLFQSIGDAECLAVWKAFGLLIALALYYLGGFPRGISPWAVVAAIMGQERFHRIDEGFIRHLDPDAEQHLVSWLSIDGPSVVLTSEQLTADSTLMYLLSQAEIHPASARGPRTVDRHRSITVAVLATALLGSPMVFHNREFIAFQTSLSLPLTCERNEDNIGNVFVDTFRCFHLTYPSLDGFSILGAAFRRDVEDPEQIFEHLSFVPRSSNSSTTSVLSLDAGIQGDNGNPVQQPNQQVSDGVQASKSSAGSLSSGLSSEECVRRFGESVKEYLRGEGHPSTVDIEDLGTYSERNLLDNPRLFRSRLLLKTVCGSPLLLPESYWCLMFNFVEKVDTESQEGLLMSKGVFSYHTCFKTVDIYLSPTLRDLLAWDDRQAAFEHWFHMSLLGADYWSARQNNVVITKIVHLFHHTTMSSPIEPVRVIFQLRNPQYVPCTIVATSVPKTSAGFSAKEAVEYARDSLIHLHRRISQIPDCLVGTSITVAPHSQDFMDTSFGFHEIGTLSAVSTEAVEIQPVQALPAESTRANTGAQISNLNQATHTPAPASVPTTHLQQYLDACYVPIAHELKLMQKALPRKATGYRRVLIYHLTKPISDRLGFSWNSNTMVTDTYQGQPIQIKPSRILKALGLNRDTVKTIYSHMAAGHHFLAQACENRPGESEACSFRIALKRLQAIHSNNLLVTHQGVLREGLTDVEAWVLSMSRAQHERLIGKGKSNVKSQLRVSLLTSIMDTANPNPLLDPEHIRGTFTTLQRETVIVLRTQRGDAVRLSQHQQLVQNWIHLSQQYQNTVPAGEFQHMMKHMMNIAAELVRLLDEAKIASADEPDAPPPSLVTVQRTGKRGRPKIVVDDLFLDAMAPRMTPAAMHSFLNSVGSGINKRTLRRRVLEGGHAEAGAPVFNRRVDDKTGEVSVERSNMCCNAGNATGISDQELDNRMRECLLPFIETNGRSMTQGLLVDNRIRVPRVRAEESRAHVQGLARPFQRVTIQRRTYHVAGANALWHHDGQHGLIKYKMVVHCFVDGKSWFITGLRVHNNNRADMVIALFLDAVQTYGLPSRVRGDHGTENLKVAEYMELTRGSGRGSYIWGQSVHNTRIERIWVDAKTGFVHQWSQFFLELEQHEGLVTGDLHHIWLLHHLFLDQINHHAALWVCMWNEHTLSIKGGGSASPSVMYGTSFALDGIHGWGALPANDPETVEADYGTEPDELERARVVQDFADASEDTRDTTDTSTTGTTFGPRTTPSHVPCDPPNCPLTPAKIHILNEGLCNSAVQFDAPLMTIRRTQWALGLRLYNWLVELPYDLSPEEIQWATKGQVHHITVRLCGNIRQPVMSTSSAGPTLIPSASSAHEVLQIPPTIDDDPNGNYVNTVPANLESSYRWGWERTHSTDEHSRYTHVYLRTTPEFMPQVIRHLVYQLNHPSPPLPAPVYHHSSSSSASASPASTSDETMESEGRTSTPSPSYHSHSD